MRIFSLRHWPPANKWLVLVAATLGMFMSLLDHTIVNVMIPQLQQTFGTSVQSVQWVVTIYMLTQAAVIPTAPYLAARFGASRAYLWTLGAFLAGSLLCGLAWDLPSLVAARLFQGIGGGILLPLVMTLVYQNFEPSERGTASSTMGMALMAAPALGPVLGGYLVGAFGWQSAFLINVPLGLAALLIARRVLPPPAPSADRSRFDTPGFTTVAAGSVLLLYAVSTIDLAAIGTSLALLLGGLALLACFVTIELAKARRGQTPLLDLRYFGDRTFALSSITHVCVSFARFGVLFLFPIYLQSLRRVSAFESGMMLAVMALAVVMILPFAGRLADRLGPRPVVLAGVAGLITALGLMTALALDTSSVLIVAILFLIGASSGLIQQTPVAAMANISKDQHAAVANGSTLLTVLHATAAPLGVAICSTLMQLAGQRQGPLAGLHQSVLLAIGVAAVGLAAMAGVPSRRPARQPQDPQSATV